MLVNGEKIYNTNQMYIKYLCVIYVWYFDVHINFMIFASPGICYNNGCSLKGIEITFHSKNMRKYGCIFTIKYHCQIMVFNRRRLLLFNFNLIMWKYQIFTEFQFYKVFVLGKLNKSDFVGERKDSLFIH